MAPRRRCRVVHVGCGVVEGNVTISRLPHGTVVQILVVNYLVWRKSPSLRFCGTIALMVAGAVIAGLGDAAFSADGYVQLWPTRT